MALLKYTGVGIRGIAAAVPKNIINNYEYTEHFPKEDVKDIVDKVGIFERRFTDKNTTSSDLSFAAAEKLLNDLDIDRSEIELLIFVSQTPDYRMPASSIILQDRLGLPNSTIAFDLSLGCSAFIYGLSVVYSFMEKSGIKKALLLNGETRSKVYSPKDRMTAFIFGDAGVAALIDRDKKYGESYFSLNSDGSRASLIKIEGGGYRNMSSVETVKEKVVDEYGNIRTDEHGYMNGADVFNFVIREIPKDIKRILEFSGRSKENLDYYVFHQANNYINSYLAKKLKFDTNKIPATIHKYGNTSSVSIPLTIVSELQHKFEQPKELLLSGFGVGMSWASSIIKLDNIHISEIVEI
ncbi:MAG: ketoacyl-ACP synthase III [Lutibacter sp.]|uniref:3-oxoacyl-ACP synthase III family protein n=1 Tax=Lutibacter sp. TaxID=1925666 RepID=UPI001A0171D9|nr:ketoacyl-ACP synthase III [Lutibacter sp.]NOR28400.1 ketoacyl-ACP synthase III [Lutibacter sp.]